MDLPNELLHMRLGFLPKNEHWSKFRQASVRIYSLPTVREVCARYIGKIREMKRYEVVVKKVIQEGYVCNDCFRVFNMGRGYARDAVGCKNCRTTICTKCCVICRDGLSVAGYCRTCFDANPNLDPPWPP